MMRGYIVPHSHWDREWYLTFQQFRFKLVKLVDQVLDISERDPSFSHFTLDGQAVVLEDYLRIRPESRERLEKLVQEGRLLIGPWYVLPDEFLVSGESMIRNLQLGLKVCAGFGGAMQVGYVPDQFGHIAQLPQILKGCAIDSAVLWRGVGSSCQEAQFRWVAPDGSGVDCIYLADSYGNAASLPDTAQELSERLAELVENQKDFLSLDAILLMNGSDHLMPQPHLTGIIAEAGQLTNMELIISTIPAYIELIRKEGASFPVIKGELRSGERAPLLVSCASSRIHQKVRNFNVETLLEKYAEPLAAWSWSQGLPYPKGFLQESWRQLLLNHPHDSICGCSNDQVHREIEIRFDEAEQIGSLIKKESVTNLTRSIDTSWFTGETGLLTFNPHPRPTSGLVEVELPEQGEETVGALLDNEGAVVPFQQVTGGSAEFFSVTLTPLQVRAALSFVSSREFQGLYINDVKVGEVVNGEIKVDIIMGTSLVGEIDLAGLKSQAYELLKDKEIKKARVTARQGGERGIFIAAGVPGCGWRSYQPLAVSCCKDLPPTDLQVSKSAIENSFYKISFNGDGTLNLLDKKTGQELPRLHRLVDGGDRGDLYTYTRPESDILIENPHRGLKGGRVKVEVLEVGPVRASVRLSRVYRLPASLAPDRKSRSKGKVDCRIVTMVSLLANSPGVHFVTTVENKALDHRLRVHFPASFATDTAWADGHFAVTRRTIQPPPGDYEQWAEKPDGLAPQKTFVSIDNGSCGLSLINMGLPEYEVLPGRGKTGAEIALTLLRSVGWLSREDLANRPGHAGPAVETPEGQCQGSYTFNYVLVPHQGSWQEAGIKELAGTLTAPLHAAAVGKQAGQLAASHSMLTLTPSQLELTCVKRSEDGQSLMVRFFNCSPDSCEGQIAPGFSFREVFAANLLEEPVGDALNTAGGMLRLPLRPWEIVTLRFNL